jgi:hypothetical protein
MRYKTTRQVSPSPLGGNRRSGRVEAQRDYLLGLICRSFYLIRRTPDLTLLEIQERLIHNCGERFSISVLWRVFDAMASRLKRMARSVCKRVYRDRRLIQSACLMTFRAEKARRNRWERVAALSSAARVGSGVC